MSRISETELQHLKHAVSLVEVARSQGHRLIKRGNDVVLLCPFHEEKTPSCVISPEKNLYHCFGCDAGGSVVDWLMKTERISLRKAAEQLRQRCGGGDESEGVMCELKAVSEPENEVQRQGLLNEVLAFYHHTLLTAPEARRYLESRGLFNPELVATFRLGYANRTLAYRLPGKKLKAGALIRKQLQQLGILRESGHEHFHGSLVIPVIGQDGAIHELYGRKINQDLRKGTPMHLYLPGAHRGVFNEAGLVNTASIILCESLIDALSFWAAGYRNVTATYGVNGMTACHWRVLSEYGIKQVLIAFDNDVAGNEAAIKRTTELQQRGIEVWRIVLPAGRDANEYFCASDDKSGAFKLLVDSAVPAASLSNAAISTNSINAVPLPSLASSLPSGIASQPGIVSHWDKGELFIAIGEHEWRVRGLSGHWRHAINLKVNLQLLDKASGALFSDNLDLLSARSRQGYARQAGGELALAESELRRELGQLLPIVETAVLPEEIGNGHAVEARVILSDREQQEALALLRDESLITRLLADLNACGVVGESNNLLAAYLAATSRKLDKPLAILIQSSSAAGKSSVMEAVLNLIPPEERLQYSAMTGQSLFYLGETNLQHKILAIAEEEGVRQAAYALKLLQSDGELTIASTGKDEQSGNLVTKHYTVKGPVMLMLTTTAMDIDEELLNRCLVLSVNESREQTEAIHAAQRYKQTLEGLIAETEKDYLISLHQNAQRLLKPLKVVNPYAHQLTFTSDKTRTRRDHMKYLTLIQSIALLHQYQREIKQLEHRGQVIDYINVTKEDITLANQLAHELLGRTLDELPPQSRKLLLLIREMVIMLAQQRKQKANEVRFTRRDIRQFSQWSDNQLKVHCQRLTEMEYLLIHGGCRGQLLQYELLWDGEQPDEQRLSGLINAEEIETIDNKPHPVSNKTINKSPL